NSAYTGTMTAVIGRLVANRIVSRNGRLSRDLNRDSGYAASAAHATVRSVAPPHMRRLLNSGLKVISVSRMASKLCSVRPSGAFTRRSGCGSRAERTTQTSGSANAAASRSRQRSAARRRAPRREPRVRRKETWLVISDLRAQQPQIHHGEQGADEEQEQGD